MGIGIVVFQILDQSVVFLSALLWNCFLCWDRGNGAVPPTLNAARWCSFRAGSDLGLESGLVAELCQLGFIFLRKSGSVMIPYKTCPKRDSNLGPKCLSLLEFEMWRLRPLGHHCRYKVIGYFCAF